MEDIISKDILEAAGFKNNTSISEAEYFKVNDGLDDYAIYTRWTNDVDKNPSKVLKLDIDNGLTNSGRIWHLHVDNNDCCTIGSADINTIEQFNLVMKIFDSNFRL